MEVVGQSLAYYKVRALVALAGVVAASAVLAPVAAAPGEQTGYRRLVDLESTRSFSDELTAALASSDTSLAGRAALALGRTEDPRAAGPLKNATSTQDVPLRALAVYGYGLLAAKNPIDAGTVALALSDKAGAVRVAAIDAAWRARAGRSPGAGLLADRLLILEDRDADPIVRERAATALSGWDKAGNRAAIADRVARAFSRERNPMVRWHEAWTLRRAYAAVTPASTVRAGLADRDELVRIQFADLVARRKNPAAIGALRALLGDRSWRVREQVLESIRVLSGRKRTEHLTAVPAGVVTPPPAAPNVEPAVAPPDAAPAALGRPTPSQARLDLALRPSTSALMDGPMPGPHPRVRIGTTQGTIVVRLYPEWAPLTVANFLNLVDRGYYDNVRWYRVVPDFVAQTGGHLTGKPDNDVANVKYTVPAEENPLEQRSGVISMGLDYTTGKDAHAKRDSANVEFYITISPQLHLNRDFTVFGEVESGFSTLGRLLERDRMTEVVRLADD